MKKIRKVLIFMFLFISIIGLGNKVFASTVTWNPTDKGDGATLSNNNLTAIFNGGLSRSNVRSNIYVTSGKWYCEFKVDPQNFQVLMFGVANGDFNINGDYFNSSDQLSYYSYNGTIYPSQASYGSSYAANDVIGMAIDIDNKKIKFSKNGNWYDDFTLPTWDKYYVHVGTGSSSVNNVSTINFGGTPFVYSVPTGYLPFDNGTGSTISLDKSTNHLQVGQTDSLVVTTNPSDKEVIWSSSDKTIATVDQNGKVAGIKEGKVVITATIKGTDTKAICEVTITKKEETKPNEPEINSGKILNIDPEKDKIKLKENVTADIVIDNIKEIAAEDMLIKYDNTKLKFLGSDEVDGIKLVKNNEKDGELRVITASKGLGNIANSKKILLKLNFQGIIPGEALVDIIKGKVSDGIEMEKDLTADQCGEAKITIEEETFLDVNNDGVFTLLDLAIDGRHYGKNPATLQQYNTDIVINQAIDNDDLLKIGEYMLQNSEYKLK